MVWGGQSSSYEPGDENQVRRRPDVADHPIEALEQVCFILRQAAIEDYADRLPRGGRIPKHELETEEDRERWEVMSALLALADSIEAPG